MKVNWDTVSDDMSGFDPLPDGQYPVKVVEVEERSTSKGDPMWSLQLEVLSGQYAGRIIFDNITWSEAGMKRVKFVLRRLGLELSGEQEIKPEDLVGKAALVTTMIDTYFSEKHGKEKRRNQIPFDGYERLAPGAVPAAAEAQTDVPF